MEENKSRLGQGLFQKLSGGHIFFQTPPPPGQTWESEPPPQHVSALINPPHYGSNMPRPPGQVTPTPHPLDMSTNPPHRTKKCLQPTQDNFWKSPKAKQDMIRNSLKKKKLWLLCTKCSRYLTWEG